MPRKPFISAFILFLSLLIFNDEFFKQSDEGVHNRGEHAKDKYRAHNEVELKHLPTVDNQIANPRFGDDILAHNRANPRHTHVDFEHRDKIGQGGGNDEFG